MYLDKGVVSTPPLRYGWKMWHTFTQQAIGGAAVAYAILRTAKLKSVGNIGGSLAHNYRTRETPNADEKRAHLNRHSMGTAEEVKQAIEARLPEKRRSDAVLCVEYFIGASPEYFDQSDDKDGLRYFETAKKWLEDRHGKENVIATSVHMDETSPHLVAYVVPLDENGKLNAKKFLGGRATLSAMQSDFAETVKHHGLDRGVEGSKAKHTTIQEYYSKVNSEAPSLTDGLDLPKKKTFESHDSYDERLRGALREQLLPRFDVLEVKAKELEQAKKEVSEAKETVKAWQENFRPAWEIISPLDREQRSKLLGIMKIESDKMIAEKERQKVEAEAVKKAEEERKKAEKIASIQRKRSLSKAKTFGKSRGL